MSESAFLAAVIGKRIVNVVVASVDSMGNPPAPGEVIIMALELDDGSSISFDASGQVGYSDVWACVQDGPAARK